VSAVKKLRRLAKRDDVDLWSLDECHFQQHGSRCRMWIPPEVRNPVVMHASTRKSVACFGAVDLGTGRFVSRCSPIFNAETFHAFIRQLLRHRRPGKRIIAVLDNAKYHHARLLKPLLHQY
jgi:hypothetical protein